VSTGAAPRIDSEVIGRPIGRQYQEFSRLSLDLIDPRPRGPGIHGAADRRSRSITPAHARSGDEPSRQLSPSNDGSARACLDRAAELIKDVPGPVLELGLGNGRTYDHLCRLMPRREIYVFEREMDAPPDCLPPLPFLVLGDGRETLPLMTNRLPRSAALAHFNMGTGVTAENDRLTAEIAPLLVPLMRSGAVVVSNRLFDIPDYAAIPLPTGIEEGRYHLYRVR
jgi:hypothetical protein